MFYKGVVLLIKQKNYHTFQNATLMKFLLRQRFRGNVEKSHYSKLYIYVFVCDGPI